MVGLVTLVVIAAVRGQLAGDALWPAAAAAHPARTVWWMLALAILSGGIPLLIYFKGLELTRASTAGYFEMMQTLTAVAITWTGFGAGLLWYQVLAAIVLIGAVAMVQRAQQQTALPSRPSRPSVAPAHDPAAG